MNVLKQILNPSEEYIVELASFASTLDEKNPVEVDVRSLIALFLVTKFPDASRNQYFDLLAKKLGNVQIRTTDELFT